MKRCFVADVGDVGTRKTGRLTRQKIAVDLLVQFQVTHVNGENLGPFVHVGQADVDLAVETAGSHERLVQNIDAVGGRQHDHARIGLEAVHLGKQLVERVLPLVVARKSGVLAAGATDRVDLVDEDDAGRLLLGLLEQIAHARSTHADEHLHEVRTRNRKERHVGLAGHGLRQQRLARSRRADEQRPLRNLGTQIAVFFRLAQEIHDLHHLDLGLLQSGYILERHTLGRILVVYLRLGLTDVHQPAARSASAARHAAHDEEPHADDEHPRQEIEE